MKIRKTAIIEGYDEELNELLALFEDGKIGKFNGFQILDMSKTVEISTVHQRSLIPQTQGLLDTIQEEVISIFDFWRECLEFKGMQLVRGESINRVIQFPQVFTELSVTVSEINETEIQVFLKVRAIDGKGYLPENLIISIFDEEGELIPNIQTAANTSSFDITHNQKFICGSGDRFSISLTLGNETVVENFPR
ncbi:MAG: DUF1822 family protein [Sphaerospermopsis kisseleviana]